MKTLGKKKKVSCINDTKHLKKCNVNEIKLLKKLSSDIPHIQIQILNKF